MSFLQNKGVSLNLHDFEIYKHVYYDCFVFKGLAGSLYLSNYLNMYMFFDAFSMRFRFSDITKQHSMYISTYQQLINSILINIYSGFYKNFKIVGLGYRYAFVSGNSLQVKFGWTHFKIVNIPFFFVVTKEKNMSFQLYGINLKDFNNICKIINKLKFPDVYKGKGIYMSFNSLDYIKKFSKKKK